MSRKRAYGGGNEDWGRGEKVNVVGEDSDANDAQNESAPRHGRANQPHLKKELKYFDASLDETALTHESPTTCYQINAITQGSASNQRVGKRINLKSVQVRWQARAQDSTGISRHAMVIIYDSKPTSSAVNGYNVFVNPVPWSMLNPSEESRFRVLRRVEFAVIGSNIAVTKSAQTLYYTLTDGYGEISQSVTSSVYQYGDIYVPLDGLETVFKAAGTGVATTDIVQGAIYIMFLNYATNGACLALYESRIRFTE